MNAPEDLIGRVYDAAAQPEQWAEIFAQLRQVIGADTSIFSLLHQQTGQALVLACNAPEPFVQGYRETWWSEDVWAAGAARQLGQISVGSEILPDYLFVRSALYNDFVKQTSDIRDTLGVVFDVADWRVVIGLHRPVAGTFGVVEREFIRSLLPHITRSLQIKVRFQELAQWKETAQAAIDLVSFGLMVVDRQCRPLVINRAAEQLLKIGDGLTLSSADRILGARRSEDSGRLASLVAGASSGSGGSGGALRIARTSGEPDYLVMVAPIAGVKAKLFASREPAAMVIIQDPRRPPVPIALALSDLYGLTPAEAGLAAKLSTGATLDEIAQHRNVKISTLRTQLSVVLAKTGTTRQAQLLSLLAKLQILS
jgi:DNA-binding CsgD family transcriptional regulator/PAS domain-containing protein